MPICRTQWSRGLRRGSVALVLLGLRVRILPVAWISFYCECCVLSGRGLCFGLITYPEGRYRMWCVWVWSWYLVNKKALAHYSCRAMKKNIHLIDPPEYKLVSPNSVHSVTVYNFLPNKLEINWSVSDIWMPLILTHWGRSHLNCLNARSRGF